MLLVKLKGENFNLKCVLKDVPFTQSNQYHFIMSFLRMYFENKAVHVCLRDLNSSYNEKMLADNFV